MTTATGRNAMLYIDGQGNDTAVQDLLAMLQTAATIGVLQPGSRVQPVQAGEEHEAVEEVEQGWVLDYDDYFLVLTTRPVDQRDNGRFGAAIREREHIADEVVDGLTAG